LVLGQVSQVNTHDIAVALPNNLTGYVSLTRISPTITKIVEAALKDDDSDDEEEDETETKLPSLQELFTPGQWLRTVVVENTALSGTTHKSKKKHIALSIEPEMVNASISNDDVLPKTLLQVSVNSIEDHGFIVSTGLANLTGFIKKSALGGLAVDNIKEGQVFLACVLQRPKNGVVQLSLDLKASQTPIADVTDVSSLLPGDTVQCLVTEVRDIGAGGKILGILDATIDQLHIGTTAVAENKNVDPSCTHVLTVRLRDVLPLYFLRQILAERRYLFCLMLLISMSRKRLQDSLLWMLFPSALSLRQPRLLELLRIKVSMSTLALTEYRVSYM
jgi:rRNA biogenesis protein RRP5